MNFIISYAITVSNEDKELNSLLKVLSSLKRNEDEIVVQVNEDNHNQDVLDVIKNHNLKIHLGKSLNSTKFKNNFKKLCKGDYIFQLDADESPAEETVLNLHRIIESNLDVDVFAVPRINVIAGSNDSDFERFNLNPNEYGFANWPDYQYRIFKNTFNIKWGETLGYYIKGAKTGVKFPDTSEYSITKMIKSEDLLTEYSKNITLCLCVANSEDCLDKFFGWALPRFKNIIVLQSESEDSTPEMLERYKSKYPNQIELHFKEIKNIADQKQHCIDLAKTEWKLIVDADEILENYNWHNKVKDFEIDKIDLGFLPRYNLQKDEKHYLKTSYPDLQPRLLNSKVKFSTDPNHETHHVMVGHRNHSTVQDCHIIHWGHIRSEEQNLWKSNMRKVFASTDACDGEGLLSHKNWFHERNKILKLDENITNLPEQTLNYINSV